MTFCAAPKCQTRGHVAKTAYQLAERPAAIVYVAYVRLCRAPHAIV
jgi:hypothetical protein